MPSWLLKIPNKGLFCIQKTPTLHCRGDPGAAGKALVPMRALVQATRRHAAVASCPGLVAHTRPSLHSSFKPHPAHHAHPPLQIPSGKSQREIWRCNSGWNRRSHRVVSPTIPGNHIIDVSLKKFIES